MDWRRTEARGAVGAGGPQRAEPSEQPAEPALPLVPHLFAQRCDALPGPVVEEALLAAERQRTSAAASTSGRGWFSGFFGFGGGRPDVRSLLRARRRQELPADADTPDLSSEPYDSIPRQIQLQWRTYAKLYPDEAAAEARLQGLLGADVGGGGGSGAEAGAVGGVGAPPTRSSVTGGAAQLSQQGLPSVHELQRMLAALAAQQPRQREPPPPQQQQQQQQQEHEQQQVEQQQRQPTAALAPSAPAPAAAAAAARLAARDAVDPVLQRLRASLERWQLLQEALRRPLARGFRARVVALYGPVLPYDWAAALRRCGGAAASGLRAGTPRAMEGGAGGGVHRALWGWCGAAVGAVGAAVGARVRPQLWEVAEPLAEVGVAAAASGAAQAAALPGGLAGAQLAAARLQFGLRKATLALPGEL